MPFLVFQFSRATACPARRTFESRERCRQRVASDSVPVLVQCTQAIRLELPRAKTISLRRIGYRRDGRTKPVALRAVIDRVIAVAALFSRRAFASEEIDVVSAIARASIRAVRTNDLSRVTGPNNGSRLTQS